MFLMTLFRHFHKTPFWSQLVFGLVAIFALPEIQATLNRENEQNTVINQLVTQYTQVTEDGEQQTLFIAERHLAQMNTTSQAVVFCKILTKSYRFDGDDNHPIRAGPIA
ncbi:secA translation cis-regulator SecM [Actinobacillus pleuropneumoniae]|uniref:Uncharacterized protein n=5 Tax=Actinobacillus TaxID=713 RepID=B0BSP5_ACTPJ|nr:MULTISPECIES: secA translation cis-regulator SecM [Actinobacillus]ABY68847.1 hypothetical protein APJL_0243 [Actinobacillus pleuropneumoniae serovar 3 str. JL03]ACE60891.1 hypothetical protein APP7_0239 [Actinobacillus pleuropneumoniae serovar 7 str. AP76]AWG94651.1 DUF2547 domain-containing protein [Actinobacillus pleuropneumoniae serovar 1 str. 4074]AXA20724.1 DUF2547 family protein [Actinobacillus pleuropneumoniae]EFM94977.1 hypothetical protein appser9_2590 [Actinobacillus pleuropneumon